MVERDARRCSKCGSSSPFGFQCPACLKIVERGYALCSGCSRPLSTLCPYCAGQTFVAGEFCDLCGKTLMIQCENKRCAAPQFLENTQCTACGTAIKNAKKQIEQIKKGK